jgi:quercetin dioxygenase-like cupin family protein
MSRTRVWTIITVAGSLAAGCAALVSATQGSNFVTTVLKRQPSPVRINIKTHPHEVNDVLVQTVVGQPGGYSGWHSHPGWGFVYVNKGVAALYDGRDPGCNPTFVGQKDVFVEEPGHVHYVKSLGPDAYEAYATFVLPDGVPARTDEPKPPQCPENP